MHSQERLLEFIQQVVCMALSVDLPVCLAAVLLTRQLSSLAATARHNLRSQSETTCQKHAVDPYTETICGRLECTSPKGVQSWQLPV